MPNQKVSKIYTLKNGIKIGVIGLSTISTPASSVGFAPPFSINNITFLPYKEIVINESKLLREKGANAVIIVSHVSDNCFNNYTFGIWTRDS